MKAYTPYSDLDLFGTAHVMRGRHEHDPPCFIIAVVVYYVSQHRKYQRKESCFISLGVWEKSLALFETLNEILDFGIEAEREMDPRARHPL